MLTPHRRAIVPLIAACIGLAALPLEAGAQKMQKAAMPQHTMPMHPMSMHPTSMHPTSMFQQMTVGTAHTPTFLSVSPFLQTTPFLGHPYGGFGYAPAAALTNGYTRLGVPATLGGYGLTGYGTGYGAGNGYGAASSGYGSYGAGSGGYGAGSGGYGAGSGGYGAGSGGYGAGSGGYGAGGSGYGSSSPGTNPYTAGMPSSAKNAAPSAGSYALDGLGLPTEAGRLSWPLGLRVLAPAAKSEALRRQVESLLQQSAMNIGQGSVPPGTVDAAALATGQLRKLLDKQRDRGGLAEQTIRDSVDFLDRLEMSLTAMRR